MSSNEAPSLVGSHIKYAQGAASSALGYESGESTKKEAVQEMKAASAQNNSTNSDGSPGDGPTQSTVLGQVENKIGQVTGCEGMEKDGAARIPQGSEASSGTG